MYSTPDDTDTVFCLHEEEVQIFPPLYEECGVTLRNESPKSRNRVYAPVVKLDWPYSVTAEDREHQRKMRNRISAREHRRRVAATMDALKKRVKHLEAENKKLRAYVREHYGILLIASDYK